MLVLNPQEGIIDGVKWFATQEPNDPTLLHVTMYDVKTRQYIYYDFVRLDLSTQRFDLTELIEKYKEWFNSKCLPETTNDQSND